VDSYRDLAIFKTIHNQYIAGFSYQTTARAIGFKEQAAIAYKDRQMLVSLKIDKYSAPAPNSIKASTGAKLKAARIASGMASVR
jgi:hypothetical protein